MTISVSATTSYIMLRHLYFFGSTYYALTPLFSTIPYLRVPIVLCPSQSLIPIYTSKHLYDKNLNNMTYRNNYTKSQVINFVLQRTYGYPLYKNSVMYSFGRLCIMICKLCYMYTIIEDHCMWSCMLSVFPLSYKLSTGVSSM